MVFVRSILKSASEEAVRAGNELVKQVKIYPLSKADSPPPQKFVDMTDILYDGLFRYDESLYASLARILNEEPVQPRDLEIMGLILPLGIEKGKEFKPDAATTTLGCGLMALMFYSSRHGYDAGRGHQQDRPTASQKSYRRRRDADRAVATNSWNR
jgi:hypothetical protein